MLKHTRRQVRYYKFSYTLRLLFLMFVTAVAKTQEHLRWEYFVEMFDTELDWWHRCVCSQSFTHL